MDEQEHGSGEFDGGLSNTKKVTGVRVIDPATGEIIDLDKLASRLGRMRRRVRAWAEVTEWYMKRLGNGYRLVMVTLTYRPGVEWQPGHIRAFTLKVRRRLGAGLVAYAWVAELQERGAVHYHCLLIIKQGTELPMPDKAGWWPHGMSRVETARTVWYVAKYTGKEYQKAGEFPKGLRLFAVWVRRDAVSEVERWLFRLSTLPGWLRGTAREHGPEEFPKRRKGGGWMLAGAILLCPYLIVLVRGAAVHA